MGDLLPADYRTLFEAAPGLYLVLAPDLRIVEANQAYLRATRTTREQILGRNIFDVFPDNPDDPAATGERNLRASLQRVLQVRQADTMPVQKYDVQRPAAEGGGFEERYWSPVNSPVLGAHGEVVYILHRVEDVTDFMHLKQAGSEREERARAIETRAGQMQAEIYQRSQEVAEANQKLTAVNEALGRLYRQIGSLMAHADDELHVGEGQEEHWESETQHIAPEEMLARIGQLIAGHKRLEEQLRQAQRMEAIGRLAGGVAHDFNNLLTVITGYAELLQMRQTGGAAVSELQEIEKASLRAAALTHKLLAFSRKQVLQPRIIELNTVVAGMEELLRRLIGEDILLVTILGGKLGNVKADPNQIEQVIMNLAVNARDAMPTGGRLIMETSSVHLDAPFRSLRPGTYVLLTVSDTGHGMDQETAARIFEPFFTTKELGKGTGLGLSTVYGIVEQSGGMITVDSAPGTGAVFRVYLPVSEAAEEHPQAARAATRSAVRAGVILLVEDEAPLRKLVSSILRSAGYKVLEAANGDEAIAVVRQDLQIDLLITDVVMPGMSGLELVSRLRPLRSDLVVLFTSGYSPDLIDQRTLERTASFLPKPFTPRTILARVSELLGTHRHMGASGG